MRGNIENPTGVRKYVNFKLGNHIHINLEKTDGLLALVDDKLGLSERQEFPAVSVHVKKSMTVAPSSVMCYVAVIKKWKQNN